MSSTATMTTTTTTTTTPTPVPANRQKKSVDNTVFVRFVPPPQHKVLRHQVEDIFSQIGPIKKSNWINNNSSSTNSKPSSDDVADTAATTTTIRSSKGYGFVKYVSQQDAQTASQELDNTKIQMDGREYTLKVELASRSTATAAVAAASTAPVTTPTLVASNKNDNNNKKRKANSLGAASAVVAAEVDHDISGNADDDPQQLQLQLQKKSSRIILRNLSFYAKESHIVRAMQEQFGKVVDVHLPRCAVVVDDDNHHNQGKQQQQKQQKQQVLGFGFCTFADPADAQKAVDAKQVTLQKRTVQLDWSVPKNVHQQQQKQQKNQQQPHPKPPKDDDDDELYEEPREEDKSESDGSASGDEDEDNDNEDDNSPSGHDGSSADDDGDNDVEMDKEEEADSDIDSKGDQDINDDAVDRKSCLFLRNLPFDTTRHDLFQLFSKYGYIKGIYLVHDKSTGMLKGTAFVTYSKASSAQRAMDDAASTMLSDRSADAASFVSQKQATKDGTSATAVNKGSLMLKGRKILVDFAVDKETAATFDAKEHLVPSADRRNLYLQAESRVESSSVDPTANNADTWNDLPPQDQKKRQSALKDKTTKLLSPIFFINPHRLSFRNLAKHVDEAGLQQLCELAITRGLDKRLVGAKDQIAHWKALGEMTTRDILAKVQSLEANGEDVIPGWNKSVNIKDLIPSVYIDRDFGPNGKKKDAPSRGFGFAEFTHHAHALACLRELNNNPAYSREFAAGGKSVEATKKRSRKVKKIGDTNGGLSSTDYIGDDGRIHVPRLIVDFTVENKIKAKKQAERRIQQQVNQQKQKLETTKKKKNEVLDADADDAKQKKQSRGAKQRQKKRQRRESGEEERERQVDLRTKAMAEATREMRKERLEQKRKLKLDIKLKSIKPPKKKNKQNKMDQDDEKFENIVKTYTNDLEAETELQRGGDKNIRASAKQKRWFD